MRKRKFASRAQLQELSATLVRKLPTDLSATIAQKWIENPEEVESLLQCLRDVEERTFEVTIYPKRTAEEWLVASKCGYCDLNLPVNKLNDFLVHTKGRDYESIKEKVVLFRLGRKASLEEALFIRNRLGLRHAGFNHLAALLERYTDAELQEFQWIDSLDVTVMSGNIRNIFGFMHPGCPHPGDPLTTGAVRTFQVGVCEGELHQNTWFLSLGRYEY
jgi:hypothetical protein